MAKKPTFHDHLIFKPLAALAVPQKRFGNTQGADGRR